MSDPIFAFKMEDGHIRSIRANAIFSITEEEDGSKIFAFDPIYNQSVVFDSCESIGDLTHRWRHCFDLEGFPEAKEIRIINNPTEEEIQFARDWLEKHPDKEVGYQEMWDTYKKEEE